MDEMEYSNLCKDTSYCMNKYSPTTENMPSSHRTRIQVAAAATVAILSGLPVAFGFSFSSFSAVKSTSHPTRLFTTRRPFITGNWKLNPSTKAEAIQLAKEISAQVNPNTKANAGGGPIALFVPFPFIEGVQEAVGDSIIVGAEVGLFIDCTYFPTIHYQNVAIF